VVAAVLESLAGKSKEEGQMGAPPPPPPPPPPPRFKKIKDNGLQKWFCPMVTAKETQGNTVWSSPPQTPVLNLHKLNQLFPAQQKAPRMASKQTVVVSLMDSKRCFNLTLMISGIKLPPAAIKQALISMDDAVLTPDHLQTLAKVLPEPEEMNKLSLHVKSGKPTESLSAVEQYFIEVMNIPHLAPRIGAMCFKAQYAAAVVEVRQNVALLLQACGQLRASASLSLVLQTAKEAANHLNHGSLHGNAPGIKVSGLLTLRDFKSSNGSKTSLLGWLVTELRESAPAFSLCDELPKIKLASQLSIESMGANLHELGEDLSRAQALLELAAGSSEHGDERFTEVMGPFCAAADVELRGLREAVDGAVDKLREVHAFYCERYNDKAPTHLLSMVYRLVVAFAEEFQAQVEREKKEAAKAERQERAESSRAARFLPGSVAARSQADGSDAAAVRSARDNLKQVSAKRLAEAPMHYRQDMYAELLKRTPRTPPVGEAVCKDPHSADPVKVQHAVPQESEVEDAAKEADLEVGEVLENLLGSTEAEAAEEERLAAVKVNPEPCARTRRPKP
jgi:hypothetical protein